MVRSMYIIGLSLAFVFMIATVALFFYVDDLRHDYYSSYEYNSGSYTSSSRPHVAVTRMIGLGSAFVLMFYIFLYIFGMVKARNTTVLVMGILGLFFTLIIMVFDLVMIMDARHVSFDEVGLFFSVWGFFMLGFCIPCVFVTSPAQLEQQRLMREYQRQAFYQQWPGQYNQFNQQFNPQQQQQQGTNFNPPNQYQQFNQQQQHYQPPYIPPVIPPNPDDRTKG